MKATFLFILYLVLFLPLSTVLATNTTLTISELLPDALGTDGGKEYIEICNSSSDINIKDWYFISISQGGTTKKILLPEVIIKAKSYFVVAEDLTFIGNGINIGIGKLALPNDFGRLQLFNSSGILISEVEYGDSKEGIAWDVSGPLCSQVSLSTINSPGVQNSNYKFECFINETPTSYPSEEVINIEKIEVSLDQNIWTDTISTFVNTPIYFRYKLNKDKELHDITWKTFTGDLLSNPHIFQSEYDNKIILEASYNSKILKSESSKITINNNIPHKILITEVYPSPESPDREWIELFNNNDVDINLSNYHIEEKTSSGNSNNRTILSSQIIKPKEYFLIYEDEFNVSLNNSGDSIYLFDLYGNILDQFIYSEVDKSKSVGKKLENNVFSDETYTTLSPTPLGENKFSDNQNVSETLNVYSISSISSLKSGTELLLNATINNYIDKYIFISDATGKFKAKLTKEVSEDLINTDVHIKAKVTTSNGAKNLLINPDDIIVINYKEIDYKLMQLKEVTLDDIGKQFRIEGNVAEVYSNRYKIKVDDELINIYSSNTSDIVKGKNVNVTGTLDYYRNTFRIIEIEHFFASVEGVVNNNQPMSYPTTSNYLIPQEYKEDYSKIYLVTFGYITLSIIFLFEIIRSRKTILKFVKSRIATRINILGKPVIKY